MKKRVISVVMTMVLTFMMIVPAMAGNGDGTGEDTFPSSVSIHNTYLLGEYTLGTQKIFKVSTYASGNEGAIVKRKLEISGTGEISNIEFFDGDSWKDISEYNVQISLKNDVERQIRVSFNEAGIYTIKFSLLNDNDTLLKQSKRVVSVSNEGIALYVEPETTEVPTTEVATTEAPTTEVATTEAPTTEAPTTEAPTTEAATTEAATTEVTTTEALTAESTTTVKETTKDNQTTVNTTTSAIINNNTVTIPEKAKIKKVSIKKIETKKIKLSIKSIKGVTGYQVAVYKTKANANMNKKAIVKKHYTKRKIIVTSKKIKNKKKLYVRARAYITDKKGNKIYGKWSKVKKVTIKTTKDE